MDQTIYHKTTSASVAIKALDEGTGWFEGYASTFRTDLENDRILKGAFRRTLAHKGGAAIPVLLNHDKNMLAGFNFEAKEDDNGLWVKGRLNLDTEAGRMAYHLLKASVDTEGAAGLSIGFMVPSGARKKNDLGGFDYSELALKEYSVTPWPCNPFALVATVKEEKPNTAPNRLTERITAIAEAREKDFNDELAEQRVMSALYQERCDIEHALCGAVNDCMEDEEMTPDEKKAEISASLAQYAAAMGDWYSRFIDADQDSDPEEDLDEMDSSKTEKAGRKISAATAEQIKAAMAAITDGAASHAKAIGILDDLSRRAYTANDVNQPNPVGGGKSESHTENAVDTKGLDPAVVAELTKAAIEQHLASKQESAHTDTKTEGDSQELHSLLESLRSIEGLLKK